MSQTEAAGASTRMHGYDFARAIAIIGMVLINFPIFLADTNESAGTLLAWFSHIHGGRAAALFVTLAGAGIALMTRGANVWAVRRTLLLRALFLFVAGNLLIIVWWIDILHFYAFYLAIAALVLITLPRWALLVGAIAVAAATPIVHLLWPELGGDLSTRVGLTERGVELGDYWSPLGMAANVFVAGIHPVLPWIAFVMMGLWIGRHDLGDAGVRARFLGVGAGLALAAPLISMVLEQAALRGLAPMQMLEFLGVSGAPSPLYVMGAVGASMFMIALSQVIVTRWGAALPVRALVHAGQMAFTIYIAHALVGVVIPRAAFDFGMLPLGWVIAYSFAFCLLVIVLAHFYRLRFKRGPIEAIMRRLAGETPPKAARPEFARAAAPAPIWGAVLGVAAALVIGLQIAGAPPRLGCAQGGAFSAPAQLTLSCRTQSFALNVAERADVALETHSGRDLYLELYRSDGEMIGQNDDGGEGSNARLIATLEPGQYRVRVRPYDAAVGPFMLTRADSAPTVRSLQPGEVCSDSCATSRDNECDDGGPNSLYSVCALGTDCADCGIRSAADEQALLNEQGLLCANSCATANDRECDDGGANSLYSVCAYGTDCGDCGPRPPRLTPAP